MRELSAQDAHAAWVAGEVALVDIREQVEHDARADSRRARSFR